MVKPYPRLLSRAIFRSIVLLQLRSLSVSVVQVTSTGQMEVRVLGCHLRLWGQLDPCCCWGPCLG